MFIYTYIFAYGCARVCIYMCSLCVYAYMHLFSFMFCIFVCSSLSFHMCVDSFFHSYVLRNRQQTKRYITYKRKRSPIDDCIHTCIHVCTYYMWSRWHKGNVCGDIFSPMARKAMAKHCDIASIQITMQKGPSGKVKKAHGSVRS